ncbi:MAG: hypothetical protein ABH864_05245 [archaeon]
MEWQEKNKERVRELRTKRYWKNKEKISQQKASYYKDNLDMFVEKSRQWRKGLSGQQKKEQNEKCQTRRKSNIEHTRFENRINYWKQKQKALALESYKNAIQNVYNQ